jgi:diguanylate cyclase (GGDEF)-like protein/PAS domain S-box-containing protein
MMSAEHGTKLQLEEEVRKLRRRVAELEAEKAERERLDELLPRVAEEWRKTIDALPDSVSLIDRECRIRRTNKATAALLNLPFEKILGRNCFELFHFTTEPPEKCPFIKMLASRQPETEEFYLSDYKRWVSNTVNPMTDEGGNITGAVHILRDITEEKRTEERLVHLATHDALTGLPNRMLFHDRLSQALTRAQRHRQRLAVLILDLDNFKDINDSFGHAAGDKVLQTVGERLKTLLRKSDTVARMGGDEFVLLIPEIRRLENVIDIAHKILMCIRKPVVFDEHRIEITTSIGLALYPDDGEHGETLMKRADNALYRAKKQSRDTYLLYSQRPEERKADRKVAVH